MSAPTAENENTPTLAARIGRSEIPVVIMAFVFAFLISAVLILISNEDVRQSATYLFARPSDFFRASWDAIVSAYDALFRGAVYDYRARTSTQAWNRLIETLTVATPLIIAALGMAVGFRAGLFNIGGTGQLIVGSAAAAWVGFGLSLPPVIHLIAALAAGIAAGGLWGGIAGFLKARFDANEVITTIMLNWIAVNLLAWLLTTAAFRAPNVLTPQSPQVKATAMLPRLLGDQFRLHLGFVIMLLAALFLWWLMSRSTLGFRFRAVGENPRAAQVAGISVGTSSFLVMLIAGGLVGLGGAVNVLGTEHSLNDGIAGSIGFDAITVALLGRSGPVGIILAGILFAGLSTGGRYMEGQGVPIDLVAVIQALVVLFIAAPPLVRRMSGLNLLTRPRRTAATKEA
ncbi:ABC transporter permease [Helcobacillus massiliensis]|uniref:ABC transporter permease n=1 Tax=Helcobacillus massiliensis TaxID=521392 RepID=UPI0025566E5B|nr:ABC transporter permease [Helcobacillus massiliensis]MDK7742802.1 ABC transporter permease [Helcobacillus massiliensis]WOO93453.1 ABC transporter permease [Helcobacillus massiliensis]